MLEGDYVTMAGQSSAIFGSSWTEMSVLGSQVFRQALMESCEDIRSFMRLVVINEAHNFPLKL